MKVQPDPKSLTKMIATDYSQNMFIGILIEAVEQKRELLQVARKLEAILENSDLALRHYHEISENIDCPLRTLNIPEPTISRYFAETVENQVKIYLEDLAKRRLST